MGIARHPSKHTRRPWSLVLAITVLPVVVTSLDAQGKALRPSKYACPVTPNLFPLQERSGDILKFVFPGNDKVTPPGKAKDSFPRVAQRISLSVVALHDYTVDVEIPFECTMARYKTPSIDWGVHTGSFIVRADGGPNCYFLGLSAGLPGNIPIFEFNLIIPPGVEVKEVRFSNVGVEYVSQNCPWPEMEKELKEAFDESRSSPQDESKAGRFLKLLEKALPEVDCVGKGGGVGPIPAWKMADYLIVLDWTFFLHGKMEEENDLALRVFAGIYDGATGVVSEGMDDQIWEILHDKPLFILRNWDAIKNYRRTILESRWLHSPTSNLEMIRIYQDIASKEPEYKPACEEIVGILSEKEPNQTQTASIDTIKQLTTEIDQYVKQNQDSDQKLVARMNPLDPSSPGDSWHWKRIENWDEADDYFEGYWNFMKVAVWTKDSNVVFVSISEWSDSGDWAIYFNYYFDDQGRLLHIFTDFRTLIDDLKTLDFQYFQESGLILDQTVEYYDIVTKQKLSKKPEHLEQPIHEIPVYLKVTDLPFYDLIDLDRKTTGPVKHKASEITCW